MSMVWSNENLCHYVCMQTNTAYTYSFKSNQPKTRENIFKFILPQSGFEPRTRVHCLAIWAISPLLQKFLCLLNIVSVMMLLAHLETFLCLFLVVAPGDRTRLLEVRFVTLWLWTFLNRVYHQYQFLFICNCSKIYLLSLIKTF